MPHETRKKNTMTKIDGRCSLLPEERERVRFYGERPTILHIRYTLCFLFFFLFDDDDDDDTTTTTTIA